MNRLSENMDMKRHCVDLGQGRPLVLLHGWCMSARVWEPLHPLARECRLLLPDLRGHGSFLPGATFDLETLAQDLELLFQQLELRDAVLAGWSMGGLVALAAAPRLRERLAGLVLLGGTSRFTETEGYPYGVPLREVRGMAARLRRDYDATLVGFIQGMFAAGELSTDEAAMIVERLKREAPPPATALSGLELLAGTDVRGVLKGLAIPTLVIHGEEDRVCPVGAARYLAEHLPGCRLAILSGAGHAPFITQPEKVMKELRCFMEELP